MLVGRQQILAGSLKTDRSESGCQSTTQLKPAFLQDGWEQPDATEADLTEIPAKDECI